MPIMTAQAQTKEFQAETRKVLDIVINSLYTERDIFVRELSPTLRTRWRNSAMSR